jgi:hypothetical protein
MSRYRPLDGQNLKIERSEDLLVQDRHTSGL